MENTKCKFALGLAAVLAALVIVKTERIVRAQPRPVHPDRCVAPAEEAEAPPPEPCDVISYKTLLGGISNETTVSLQGGKSLPQMVA